MDQTVGNAPLPAGDVSPLKRPPIQPDLPPSSTKKARLGELSDVAEMVLVLSAMGRMRGAGRSPSEAELVMMREARARIVSACEKWAPRDLVPKEAVTSVIDDLGLLTTKFIKENIAYNVNTYNNSQLGFRPPAKLSIKERLALSKRKMEETKEFAAQSSTNHPNARSQASSSTTGDNRGTTYSVRTSQSEKSSHLPISSGSLPVPSPLGHVSAASSTSLPHQSIITEVKAPPGTITHNHGRNPTPFAMPRIDRSRMGDGGVRTGQAGAPVDRPQVNAPTWSVHPLPPVRGVSDQKVPNQMPVKVETGAPRIVPQAARDLAPKPFVMQATPGNIMSMQQQPPHNFVQVPPPLSNHPEISKIVHKFLQPLVPERPTWTPPSRDYMSKAVGCQMCHFAINEVEGVLVCDACEKGYHMKCLPSFNQKGFPRGEWHCPKCLKLSNGKPLPPKYGRVMRNVAAPRAPGKDAGVQQLSEKKVGAVDQKASQQKMTTIRTSNIQSSHSATGSSKPLASAADSKTPNLTDSINEKSSTASSLHSSIKEQASDDAPADSASRTSTQQVNISQPPSLADKSASASKLHPHAKSPDLVTNTEEKSQDFSDSKDGTAKAVESVEVESLDIAEISKEGDKGQGVEAIP